MIDQELSTEQRILESAEKEFIEKGFAGTKTVQIAMQAGVTHAMLHYYYRTKENLFSEVFNSKTKILAASLIGVLNKKISFDKNLRTLIEAHFDFVVDNPKIFGFVYNEVISNEKNRKAVVAAVAPNFIKMLSILSPMLDAEMKIGKIRKIDIKDLVMNMVAINIASVIAIPILISFGSKIDIKKMMAQRKKSNVDFIMNSLRV